MKNFVRAMTRAMSTVALLVWCAGIALAQPVPLLKSGTPVDWWFVFKFNAETGPGCPEQNDSGLYFRRQSRRLR
jgi:hypothetical protein